MRDQWRTGAQQFRGPGFDAARGRAASSSCAASLMRALRDAGAGLVLGADAPQVFNVPGFATLRELESLVAAGLTPYQALQAGTRNPAIALGVPDSFGTVAVGKRADLLLLDADPLADIRNVWKRAGVVLAGRWLPGGGAGRKTRRIRQSTLGGSAEPRGSAVATSRPATISLQLGASSAPQAAKDPVSGRGIVRGTGGSEPNGLRTVARLRQDLAASSSMRRSAESCGSHGACPGRD